MNELLTYICLLIFLIIIITTIVFIWIAWNMESNKRWEMLKKLFIFFTILILAYMVMVSIVGK